MMSKWLVEGGLVYRLNEQNRNCDEINFAMTHDSRATPCRSEQAESLANLLNYFQANSIVDLVSKIDNLTRVLGQK